MSLSKISFAIASVVVLAAGVPAFAGNDSGTVQTVIQTNTVVGNGNTTINSARQTAVTTQRGGRAGSNAAGTSQNIDQLNTVDGNNNFTSNSTTQNAVTRQNSRRP
jgi:hypothetical protein